MGRRHGGRRWRGRRWGRRRRGGGRRRGRGRRRGAAARAVVGPNVPLLAVRGRRLVLGPPLGGVVVSALRGAVALHVDGGRAPRRRARGRGAGGGGEVHG